jgi:hypothetical protein
LSSTHVTPNSKDGKSVKECKLGGTAWDISYHKKSGRIVVALQDSGIQFVDNFVAHTKISVQNINTCLGVLNLIVHGSFFNRMVPNCFISDNKVSG